MSYKEIQVPSDKIIKTYERVLAQIEPLQEQAIEKVKQNLQAEEEFDESEKEIYDRLCSILRRCSSGEREYYTLKPSRPYFLLFASPSYYSRNLVESRINTCKKMIEAAKLAEFLVLTEEQVKEFAWYNCTEIGGVTGVKEECLKWLNAVPDHESQYTQEEIDRIMKLQDREPKPLPPKSEERNEGSNDSMFWKSFLFVASLILVAWGLVSI